MVCPGKGPRGSLWLTHLRRKAAAAPVPGPQCWHDSPAFGVCSLRGPGGLHVLNSALQLAMSVTCQRSPANQSLRMAFPDPTQLQVTHTMCQVGEAPTPGSLSWQVWAESCQPPHEWEITGPVCEYTLPRTTWSLWTGTHHCPKEKSTSAGVNMGALWAGCSILLQRVDLDQVIP